MFPLASMIDSTMAAIQSYNAQMKELTMAKGKKGCKPKPKMEGVGGILPTKDDMDGGAAF